MNSEKSVRLILVRHGQASSNAAGILASYPEKAPQHLTDFGKQIVEQTARDIAKEHTVDAIICSPLTRAKETAGYMSRATGVGVQTDIRLRETDFGVFNNKSIEEFFNKYQDPVLRIHTTGEDGVEGLVDIRKRVTSFLQDVLRQYHGKTVVLVSHADTISEIMALADHQNEWASAHGTLAPGTMKVMYFSAPRA
jgi:broad specificity phosphatase PhoE